MRPLSPLCPALVLGVGFVLSAQPCGPCPPSVLPLSWVLDLCCQPSRVALQLTPIYSVLF